MNELHQSFKKQLFTKLLLTSTASAKRQIKIATIVLLSVLITFPALASEEVDPLLRSADSVNIEMITSGMMMDISRAGDRMIAVGERGHIIVSDNNGASWTQSEVPVSVTLTGVHFSTPEVGWAVGYDGVILHSNDGGKSWTLQTSGRATMDLMVSFYETFVKELEATAVNRQDDEDFLYLLEDVGFALGDWQKSRAEEACPPFMDVWFKNEVEGIAVGAFGLLLKTYDGGSTWVPELKSLKNYAGYHYYSIKPFEEKLVLAGEVGMIFTSVDDGNNWTRPEIPYDGSYFGIVGNPKGKELLAYGLRGTVVRSVDSGDSWEVMGETGGNLNGDCITSDGRVFVTGTDGNIFNIDFKNNQFKRLDQICLDNVTLIEAHPGKLLCVGLKGIKMVEYN